MLVGSISPHNAIVRRTWRFHTGVSWNPGHGFLAQRAQGVPRQGVIVQQEPVHQLRSLGWREMAVTEHGPAGLGHHRDRLSIAQPEAAHLDHVGLHAPRSDRLPEGLQHVQSPGRTAASGRSEQNPRPVALLKCFPLAARAALEFAQRVAHGRPSFLNISATWLGVSFAYTWLSTITHGDNPHVPMHATV